MGACRNKSDTNRTHPSQIELNRASSVSNRGKSRTNRSSGGLSKSGKVNLEVIGGRRCQTDDLVSDSKVTGGWDARGDSGIDHVSRPLSHRQKQFAYSVRVKAYSYSMLVFFNPIKFGITFTFGNLLSLGSTAFLIGPKRQVTMMLDPVRIYATAIFIASMIIALFCALYVHNKLLTLLAIILEFGALIWYSLSYIPFARSMVSKVMVACFDTEF
ncbi:Got1/Sft2-like vescicle transport protein family [Actinidia rufa]|uniref:Vesicle transport protein n=1 Tax=Actinidia rufa TaxID=165716 RepID=A0A7J0H700_9ERIC|nr:Got1/Sft2-like vescicle transport protein family [Actinidia rufa]